MPETMTQPEAPPPPTKERPSPIGAVGAANPRWKGGSTSFKGYRRIKSGPLRDQLEHRVVMERMLGAPIPAGFHVHHVDGNRRHNCPQNLMLIDERIHLSFNGYRWRKRGPRSSSPTKGQ